MADEAPVEGQRFRCPLAGNLTLEFCLELALEV
jgi:hypothetical protein